MSFNNAVVSGEKVEFEGRTIPLRAISVVELKSYAVHGIVLGIAAWYLGFSAHRLHITEDWEKTVAVFSFIGAVLLLFAGKVVIRADGKKFVVDRGWIKPMSKLKDRISTGLTER